MDAGKSPSALSSFTADSTTRAAFAIRCDPDVNTSPHCLAGIIAACRMVIIIMILPAGSPANL
jgi:hypothetical protein